MNPWAAVPEQLAAHLERIVRLTTPGLPRAAARAEAAEIVALARETERHTRRVLDEAAAREAELEDQVRAAVCAQCGERGCLA